MASNTIRWSLTKAIIDLLRAQLPDMQIEPGYPGDTLAAEAIWVGILDGQVDIPVMTAGRKDRDDQFDIPFEVTVRGLSDLDSTMTRLSELVSVIEDVLADDPGLNNFDGVIDAQVTRERMTSADVQGAGRVGNAEVIVSVHSRLD